MVTDWNANTEQAILTAAQGRPFKAFSLPLSTRRSTTRQRIEHKYTPYFVTERTARLPPMRRAQAHTRTGPLYPTQKRHLTTQLDDSP